jgi:hypothetical protein
MGRGHGSCNAAKYFLGRFSAFELINLAAETFVVFCFIKFPHVGRIVNRSIHAHRSNRATD